MLTLEQSLLVAFAVCAALDVGLFSVYHRPDDTRAAELMPFSGFWMLYRELSE